MRCARGLKADETLYLAPERRLPAVHFELLGIELGCGKRGIGLSCLVGDVFGSHLELAFALVGSVREAVYGQAQVRQHLVIDDVVEEYGIRVERVLRQDYTVIECAVFADSGVPGIT